MCSPWQSAAWARSAWPACQPPLRQPLHRQGQTGLKPPAPPLHHVLIPAASHSARSSQRYECTVMRFLGSSTCSSSQGSPSTFCSIQKLSSLAFRMVTSCSCSRAHCGAAHRQTAAIAPTHVLKALHFSAFKTVTEWVHARLAHHLCREPCRP